MMEKENIDNRIDEDLESRNRNWDKIDQHMLDYVEQVGNINNLTTTSKEAVGAINELNSGKANRAQEEWITPTLLNGWENTSSTTPIGYYKDTLGVVHFRGSLQSGVDNTDAFVLPVGYRPSTTIRCVGMASDSTVGRYAVNFKGEVRPHKGSGPYVYATNVTFRAEG